MEMNKIIVDGPISAAGQTLIPVNRVSLRHWSTRTGSAFMGIKQPLAVIVVSLRTPRAFRTSGEEVPLDQLMKEAPELKEVLEQISPNAVYKKKALPQRVTQDGSIKIRIMPD
ncbi:MAG: hypothetical protein JSW16_07965 [Dehalococcoidales bacterium]|nr:MAG: hypothetical protein JSW16_07965 [Dehalococcoidales bacterium]